MEMMVATNNKNGQVHTSSAAKTKKAKLGLRETGASIKDIQRSLKLGQKYAENQEWAEAVKHLMVAWDAMPDDLGILTVLSHALVQLGVREQAVYVLERALNSHKPTAELIDIIQRLAMEMGMYSVAVKLGAQLLAIAPHEPIYYVNTATAFTGAGKLDESINMLQAAIPLFPDNADLWNVLATQVRDRDGIDQSDVFFEEALRLNPNDYKIISNYSISFTRRNQFDKALELALRAIESNPDSPDPRIGAAQLQFTKGEMQSGWENYEYRLSTRRKANQTQIYTHKLPRWEGEDLEGKALFVCAEQGIGDEVMWGNYLPFLYESAAKLIIGCDPRLVGMYRRRFPEAVVAAYVDRIISGYRYRSFPVAEKMMKDGELNVDYYVPVASGPKEAWRALSDIKTHSDGFLIPDPSKVQKIRTEMDAISDKPKVAIAWRSGLLTSARSYLYASIEKLAPLMALADKVDFINLQYGDVTAELALAEELYGVKIHTFEDVNLKADIEANIAIASQCDLVISSYSAPGMFSLSVGAPTLLMSSAPPWWCFGSKGAVAFARDAEYIANEGPADWDFIVNRVTTRVQERLGL